MEFSKAKEIAARVAELYTSGEVDAVYAIYNEFKNVMVQNLRAEKLLPVDPEVVKKSADGEELAAHHAGPGGSLPTEPGPGGQGRLVDYIYEQPVEQIFNGLVPRYLEGEIFRILLESAAAEHAARMTAMDAATRNASELIEKLTLRMNNIRQAADHEGIDRNRKRRRVGQVVARKNRAAPRKLECAMKRERGTKERITNHYSLITTHEIARSTRWQRKNKRPGTSSKSSGLSWTSSLKRAIFR